MNISHVHYVLTITYLAEILINDQNAYRVLSSDLPHYDFHNLLVY